MAVGALGFAPLGAVIALAVVRRSFAGIDGEADALRDLRREVVALVGEIETVRRRVDSGRRTADG